MDDLIRAGKVRYIGTSTFAAWQVMESLWVSKELGLTASSASSRPITSWIRRIERELIPMAQTYGIGLIPWSPLAGGLLTGKYTRESSPQGAAMPTYRATSASPTARPMSYTTWSKVAPAGGCKGMH